MSEKKGANKFTAAADKFFGEVADQLEETVNLKEIPGIQRATLLAELVYKINQSLKIMKDEQKVKKENGINKSMVDTWADDERK